jgi:hypothetical protein
MRRDVPNCIEITPFIPSFCTKLYRDYPFRPFCLFRPRLESITYVFSVGLMDSTSTRLRQSLVDSISVVARRTRKRPE